jgi:hypothetical protein
MRSIAWLHAAPQSRDRSDRRCLVRSRFCEAAQKKRCIAPGTWKPLTELQWLATGFVARLAPCGA